MEAERAASTATGSAMLLSRGRKNKHVEPAPFASPAGEAPAAAQAAPSLQTVAVVTLGGTSGAVVLGVGGAVCGTATGSTLGALVGLGPAFFTFGLSIVAGAMIGGGTGFCVGAATGSSVGFIGGGAATYYMTRSSGKVDSKDDTSCANALDKEAAALEEPKGPTSPSSVSSSLLSNLSSPLRRGGGLPDDLPGCRLGHVTEQRVLKVGLAQLHKLLTGDFAVDISKLPDSPEVSRKMLGKAILARLLSREVEFKSCMENDVAGAQSDLRYLAVEQLLHIRLPTLSFQTEAGSHSARNSFLETLDKNLFSKIPPHMGCDLSLAARPESWHSLGFRIALVFGAADMLGRGWGCQRRREGGSLLDIPVPSDWVFRLQPEDWTNEVCAAHINIDKCSLDMIGQGWPDLTDMDQVLIDQVAVICDRTRGIGKDRMVHWDITMMDPRLYDVMLALEDQTETKQQQHLAKELSAAVSQRSRTPPVSPSFRQNSERSWSGQSKGSGMSEELRLALERRSPSS